MIHAYIYTDILMKTEYVLETKCTNENNTVSNFIEGYIFCYKAGST